MSIESRIIFCQNCDCKVVRRWHEPSHCLYSALTISLMAAGAATPMTASLMGLVWIQRISSTGRWTCPHCEA